MISHIAALSKNRVIGSHGGLPWRLSEDLKYFKAMTLNKCVIMGRKTFESLGRPLPSRRNVVITRDREWGHPDCDVFHDIDSAIEHCKRLHRTFGDEIMIAGGGEIFKQTLSLADRLYLTIIDTDFIGDAFYPEWEQDFTLVEQKPSEEKGLHFTFCIFERKKA